MFVVYTYIEFGCTAQPILPAVEAEADIFIEFTCDAETPAKATPCGNIIDFGLFGKFTQDKICFYISAYISRE